MSGGILSDIWNRAYCKWHRHDRLGHVRRAAVWGWTADRLSRWA